MAFAIQIISHYQPYCEVANCQRMKLHDPVYSASGLQYHLPSDAKAYPQK